jgi:hypothetical protein
MIKRYAASLLISFGALTSTWAQAPREGQLPLPKEPLPLPKEVKPDAPAEAAPSCAAGHCDSFIEKTIKLPQITLYEEQKATTMRALPLRNVDTPQQITTIEVEYKEDRQKVTVMAPKKRLVDQQITTTRFEPCTTVDPCTGHCTTTYKPVPECKTIQVEVFDIVPEEREVIVRVPVLKCVQKDVIVRQLAVDCVTIPAIEKRLKAPIVPNEVKAVVPVPPLPCPCH